MGGITQKTTHLIYSGITTVKAWQYCAIFLLSFMGTIYGLRQNNLVMTELRDSVLAADVRGDGIQPALQRLYEHTFSHMNSSTGRLQLVQTYYRDVSELQRETSISNGQLAAYNEAVNKCNTESERQDIRLSCVSRYLEDNAIAGENIRVMQLPDKNRYTFEYVSPRWSADLAGVSMLVAVISAIGLVMRVVHVRAKRRRNRTYIAQ